MSVYKVTRCLIEWTQAVTELISRPMFSRLKQWHYCRLRQITDERSSPWNFQMFDLFNGIMKRRTLMDRQAYCVKDWIFYRLATNCSTSRSRFLRCSSLQYYGAVYTNFIWCSYTLLTLWIQMPRLTPQWLDSWLVLRQHLHLIRYLKLAWPPLLSHNTHLASGLKQPINLCCQRHFW